MSISPVSSPVVTGDTLSEIAEENGIPLAELLKLNPQFDAAQIDGKLDTKRVGDSNWDPDFIRPGDTIVLRKTDSANPSTTQADPTSATTSGASPGGNVVPTSFDSSANPTTNKEKIDVAMKYFQSQGWSEAQAAGIVANLQAESNFKADVPGDGGQAYGIAQWHPDRQANFKQSSGHSIQGSTFNEQLQFVQWELTHTETATANALRGANSAGEAAAIFCRLYERPADIQGQSAYRASLAQNIHGDPGTVYV